MFDLTKPFIAVGVVIASRFLDLTDPQILQALRWGFSLCIGLSLFLLLIIYARIHLKHESTKISVATSSLSSSTSSSLSGSASLLEFFSSKSGKSSLNAEDMTSIPIEQYDIFHLKNLFQQLFFSVLISFAIFYFGDIPLPMIIQSILSVYSVVTHQLARIHLWSETDKNKDLRRPWDADKTTFGDLYRQLKREMNAIKNGGDAAATGGRKNKKMFNRRRVQAGN